ncbi:MAG: energy-coupling factor transporter ATPase [Treponemataceae bacterium]|nr:energy-coupling factor transporter ATPase [Spirochaetales bacterium]MDY6032042.1 energy-coupling factor transporter ATPase [Treponemataceae bacterium]
MPQNLISVKNVSFSYENAEVPALKDVSLDVYKGDYIAILGTNGSGKSTFSKLMVGFLPLQEGLIEVQQTGKPIGFVQQNPKYQIIATIVEKDTAFGPQVLRLSEDEIERRTIESLKTVDLTEKIKANTNSLSLGQTQKLALAGILALETDILILDEAVSMIDPETRKSILDVVDKLHQDGKTIIHITHDIEEARRANRVVILEKGKKIFDDTLESFEKNGEEFERLFGVTNPDVYRRAEKSAKKAAALLKTDTHSCSQSSAESAAGNPAGATNFSEKANLTDISLAFDGITYDYEAKKTNDKNRTSQEENTAAPAVDNVSLAFRKGTITALLGKSGSGKSTLFELGASLLAPTSGKVFCSGKTTLALQDAESALFKPVAADDVAFGPENQGLKGKELLKRVKDSMDICNLPFTEFKDRSILELSGGEKRKLALAGIIAMDSDIIFFDEPTSSLDPKSREQFFSLIQKLADEHNKTIIFSTHHSEDALAADRTIHIERGKIISDTNPCEVPNFQGETENLRYKEHANLLSGLRNTSLGEFTPKNTPIHKMNILAKTIIFLILFIGNTMLPQIPVLIGFCLASALYALLAKFSPKKLFFRMIKIIPWILFFFIWQVLLFPVNEGDTIWWSWKFLKFTDANLFSLIRMMLHFFGAMTTLSVFVYSTEITEILDGMKKYFHINVVVFFMLILRFIPLLTEELSHIVKTQIIRDGIKSTRGFFNKVKAILPIIVPLMIQTIRRSSIIAEALEARGMK